VSQPLVDPGGLRIRPHALTAAGGSLRAGALRGQRGDVRTDEWLIEDKFTDAESFSIKLTMLKKTIHEALVTGGRLPMWRIVIQGHRFRLLREEDYLWLKAQVDDNANTH
jgi:hypothetical protein